MDKEAQAINAIGVGTVDNAAMKAEATAKPKSRTKLTLETVYIHVLKGRRLSIHVDVSP